MDYEVKIVRAGRGGWVYYRGEEAILPFDWDITSDGFEVYLPPSAEWGDFCKKNNARHCMGRRQQVVARVAEEVQKKKAKKARVASMTGGFSFRLQAIGFTLYLAAF